MNVLFIKKGLFGGLKKGYFWREKKVFLVVKNRYFLG